MIGDGRLLLKLPAARVAELVATGHGRPFTAGKANPLREWVAVETETKGWLDLGVGRRRRSFDRGSAADRHA